MLHDTVPLASIGINALARALMLQNDPWVLSRFPHQEVTADVMSARARQGASKSRLVDLCRTSMRTVALSAAQEASLEALRNPLSTCVVSGQQIGLFGGPLYTVLKIRSAVTLAQELQEQHQLPVVPIFWLEDNDHDAIEAGSATLISADGMLTPTSIVDQPTRVPVSARTFTADEIATVTNGLQVLSGQYADETRTTLASIYTEGRRWNDAFLDILQPFLAEWGVLVVRASDVIDSGMHMPIVDRDIHHPGVVRSLVDIASDELRTHGYHAQATANEYSFFVHRNGERHRIESLPPLDATFSPGVLARPIVQDAILPTVASVLGAAEIAYHAQLHEVYHWFGVTMPDIVLRHSATIIDAKTERLLQKVGRDASFYMRPWQEVERDIVASMDDGLIPDASSTATHLAALLDPYRQAATSIDATLAGSVESTEAAIRKSMDALQGKMRSALKRVHAETMDRHRAIAVMVWPNDGPQERVIALATWMARLGSEKLRSIVEEVCALERTTHSIIG
ncbi:MAG: bacillithiol biosynthesis BshC [Bacteroidetes bacterium]|nr:bacillithiol biosynthesis BshC [Bacteroidota bacterium]